MARRDRAVPVRGVATAVSTVSGVVVGLGTSSSSAGLAITVVMALFGLCLWQMTLRHGLKTGRYPVLRGGLHFEQFNLETTQPQQLPLWSAGREVA